MKPHPLSWEWVRWEMAMLVFICVFLVATSHDKLKSALLIPVIPVAFNLLAIWKGPKRNDSTKEPQPTSGGDSSPRADAGLGSPQK